MPTKYKSLPAIGHAADAARSAGFTNVQHVKKATGSRGPVQVFSGTMGDKPYSIFVGRVSGDRLEVTWLKAAKKNPRRNLSSFLPRRNPGFLLSWTDEGTGLSVAFIPDVKGHYYTIARRSKGYYASYHAPGLDFPLASTLSLEDAKVAADVDFMERFPLTALCTERR